MTATTTRQIRSFGPDHIYIDGLTKGPSAGWTWDGATLSHPLGIRITLTPPAAARVTAAIDTYRPGVSDVRTAAQMADLTEAERAEYELTANGWGEDEHDNEHVWRWVRSTSATPGTCEIDTSEVVSTTMTRR